MIYEYRCNKCQAVNEFQMKMSDPHPFSCPSCNATDTLERIISRSSFALKGSGWYTSDYKRKGNSSSAKSECANAGTPASCGSGACSPKAEA